SPLNFRGASALRDWNGMLVETSEKKSISLRLSATIAPGYSGSDAMCLVRLDDKNAMHFHLVLLWHSLLESSLP
ncbi:hypothetical protein EGK_00761, partial [Macaca mulatta]